MIRQQRGVPLFYLCSWYQIRKDKSVQKECDSLAIKVSMIAKKLGFVGLERWRNS